MGDFDWRRLTWVLLTLGSAVMIWVGLVLGALAPTSWGRFVWMVSVPLWATVLKNSIETLELMAWARLTRENAKHLLLGVMAAVAENELAERERRRYQVHGDDDGARLMREISEALEGRQPN